MAIVVLEAPQMTLILTLFDRNGIVLATDSNVSSGGRVIRQARKNFELPHLRAGLSVAGCYTVDGMPMDEWMPQFIARPETYHPPTLQNLADCLRKAFDIEMTKEDKEEPTLVHIAGYTVDAGSVRPELYFVRNASSIDQVGGGYTGVSNTFQATEDFWSRDRPYLESTTGFPRGDKTYQYQRYANGLPSARQACMLVQHQLGPYFEHIWNNPSFKFHAPKTLKESIAMTRILMAIVDGLFEMTDYPDRFVGGELQLIGVPFPTKL
jgi:hypothetical protein